MLLAEEAARQFTQHWWVDLSIPLVAALIGWVTKLVAIRMMFEPVEFRGKRPLLGWQGVVPRRAARMASIAVDTMTRELVSAGEVFSRLDPDRVARELTVPLQRATAAITREVVEDRRPGLWDRLPETVRVLVVARAQAEVPRITSEVVADLQRDLDAVFDLREMVVTDLVTHKDLLNDIFREAGRKEFRFIARSGIWFGGTIGLLQMTLWIVFRQPLIMPAFGLVVGWFTDWLALKLVFNPKRAIRIGPVVVQGLFLKRRRQVAADYAALIAERVITPRKIIEAVLRGPLSDRVGLMIHRQVEAALDRSTGLARPLLVATVGTAGWAAIGRDIADRVLAQLPDDLGDFETYARDQMDVRGLLVEKMQTLDERHFEALIRPAFEQDEWILITVGAVLGFCMGEAQALLLEHVAR